MTTVEDKLRADVAAGQPANFRDWKERPIIGANLVRELVMGASAPSGVEIVYATIAGGLNLVQARSISGGECHGLVLRDCDLVGPDPFDRGSAATPSASEGGRDSDETLALDARHSQLSLLSLTNCRAAGIDLSSALIAGDLILDGLRPFPRGRSCWVRAHGLRVGGAVTVSGSRLRLPKESPGYWAAADHYALDLDGAQIAGALSLQNRFVARGGVNLARATVGGAFSVFGGTQLTAADRSGVNGAALRAAYAQLQGQVFLIGGRRAAERFCAKGKLDFYGCHVGGSLSLQGVRLTRADPEKPMDASVDLTSGTVSGGLFLLGTSDDDGIEAPFDAVDPMIMRGALIGGDIVISGTTAAPINAVDATGVRAHGTLTLCGPFAATCDFSGSVIDGSVELGFEGVPEPGFEGTPFALETVKFSEPSVLRLAGAFVGRALKVVLPITSPTFSIDLATAEHDVRATDLVCYPGWRLAEAFLSSGDAPEAAILAFLYRPDSKADIIILNGESRPIHEHNERHAAVLDQEEQVKEYLVLFCNYVWGDDGAFVIVNDSVRDLSHAPDGSWRAVSNVEYANEQFQATFRIEPSGVVSISDVESLGPGPERPAVRYDPPVRWVSVESFPPEGLDWPGFEFAPVEFAELGVGKWRTFVERLARTFVRNRAEWRWADVQARLRRDLEEQPRRSIDLRGMRAGSLDDAAGAHWGTSVVDDENWGAGPKLQLRLSGFEYGRIDELPTARTTFGEFDQPPIDQPIVDRRNWLKAQYKRYPPTADEYRPEPYQQLSRVWRAAGHFDRADDIAHDKLELEKVFLAAHWFPKFVWRWLVQKPFGFGLKPKRAWITFATVYFVGLAAVLFIPLKVDAQQVATVVSGESVVVQVENLPDAPAEIACGDHINAFIYPLDVMIPLIDLRQESRCQFSITNEVLSAGKGIYAVIGWIVTSGLILTLSGIVRRRIEG